MKRNKTIGIITVYPELGQKDSRESALAWYTKNIISSLNKAQRDKIVIFANISKTKNIYQDQNVEINRCWNRGKLYFFKQILDEVKKYPQLKTIHIQQEFNLFGSPITVFLYLYLLYRLKKFKKRVVVTYHAVVSQQDIHKEFADINQIGFPVFIVKLFFKLIYTISSFYIDMAIVHGEYFKKVLVGEYRFKPNEVKSFYMGTDNVSVTLTQDQARKILNIPTDKRVILCIGFLAGYKGIDLLLDAFSLLDKDRYSLIVAGGKPKRVENDKNYNIWYDLLIQKMSKISSVYHYDYVPEDKIQQFFMVCDVLILPHLVLFGPSGFISIAIGYNKPFLASKVFDRIFDNKEILFETTPLGLSAKIEDFFANKNKYLEFIEQLKKERTWLSLAQGTFSVYTIHE